MRQILFVIMDQYIQSLIKSLQRNPVCGFAFLGVDEVGVDLCGFDAFVGEHLGDRVDVCAECDWKRSNGLA